jgi:hypothetical protein
MPWLFSAVTNGTDGRTGNGTVPASLDGLDKKEESHSNVLVHVLPALSVATLETWGHPGENSS